MLLRISTVPWKDTDLSHNEMLYGLPYLSSVIDVPSFETKDYFLKNYILRLSSTVLCLWIKELLAQDPPLDFPVHPHQPGDYVLIKTWKENKLEPTWDRPFLVLLTMETAVQTSQWGWTHLTWVKKSPSTDQKEKWAALSHSGKTK
jgi:hypothetical protein